MRHRPPIRTRAQQGVVLIVALIMLMLITMISVSAVRSTTTEERTAGAARDRNKAFQAAEYALRSCLLTLQNGTYAKVDPLPLPPTVPPAKPVWEESTNWTGTISKEIAISDAVSKGELSANPRCLYENLGTNGSYRITTRAQGASDTTAVILQATFSNE